MDMNQALPEEDHLWRKIKFFYLNLGKMIQPRPRIYVYDILFA